MAREIKAEVTSTGEVEIEFSGFPGEACFDEANMLQKTLKELGLWAIPVMVTPKSSSEIAQELGEEVAPKKKAAHS